MDAMNIWDMLEHLVSIFAMCATAKQALVTRGLPCEDSESCLVLSLSKGMPNKH